MDMVARQVPVEVQLSWLHARLHECDTHDHSEKCIYPSPGWLYAGGFATLTHTERITEFG
jgi:hypothetical protein